MNLTEMQTTLAFLSQATLADPILALCNAIAWVDPLIVRDESFAEAFYPVDAPDDWSNIAVGWEVSRRCFPDVYAETTLALRNDSQWDGLADDVCQGINQHLIGAEMHDLEQIHWGLPFMSFGVEIGNPEFFRDPDHAPLLEIYDLLDVRFNSPYSLPENYDAAAMVARVLAISLRETRQETHTQMAWLLDWMFAQTGNTAADYTDDEFYDAGIEPLPWERDEIEFNNLMHEEAIEIVSFAYQGLSTLLNHPALQAELRTNAKKISPHVRKVKRYELQPADAHRLADRLRWADCTEPVDAGPTNAHSESLPLWGTHAA